MTDQNLSQTLKQNINNWLNEEGLQVEETTPEGFAWAFVVKRSDELKLTVAQQVGKADSCLVRVGVNIQGIQIASTGMTQDEIDELLWELKFELVRHEVDFDGLDWPLEKVNIFRSIYSDGLTKNVFADTVGKVVRAAMLFEWVLRRRLRNDSVSDSVH